MFGLAWRGWVLVVMLVGGRDDQLFIFPGFVYILHFNRHFNQLPHKWHQVLLFCFGKRQMRIMVNTNTLMLVNKSPKKFYLAFEKYLKTGHWHDLFKASVKARL